MEKLVYLPWTPHKDFASEPGGEYVKVKVLGEMVDGSELFGLIIEKTEFIDFHGFEINDAVACVPYSDIVAKWKATHRIAWPKSNNDWGTPP